jgi:hypothetical protein
MRLVRIARCESAYKTIVILYYGNTHANALRALLRINDMDTVYGSHDDTGRICIR